MKKQLTILVLIFAAAQCLFGAEAKPPAGAPLSDAQRIAYHLGQTPSVPVMLKWKTIFVLPASEKILDVVCGFKDDWDVYAPDWRGYGLTDWGKADCYWFPDYLADLDALLDRIQPEAPVRSGRSRPR